MYVYGAQKTAGGALRLKGSNPFPGAFDNLGQAVIIEFLFY